MTLTRRELLSNSASATAAAWLAPQRAARAADAGAIGIQLYTVRDALAADFSGTLRRLRELGFTEVEPAGLMGLSAAELRQRLDAAGLAAPSVHADVADSAIDASFAAAHTLGASYIVSSMLRPGTGAPRAPAGGLSPGGPPPLAAMTLDDAQRTAELANRVGDRARRAGLRYAYHNHDFEFAPQAGGAIGYDVLLAQTDPAVVELEIDCGWVVVGGRNPVDYFERYPGRVPLIHVKDFLPTGTERGEPGPRLGAELGRGTIDYAPILAAARKSGLEHAFAEQEGPYVRMSQLDAAGVAAEYLRRIGTGN
jgi:sugar phosphate isomerase/epimerase